ncbi:MAG: NAD(P)-dependent alcohol dehydrogenase, partial [Bradymonadaceae bacterium]
EEGSVRAGDTVLCLGTGGVSVQAQMIADMLGAEVIATSSSDEKLQRALDLAADEGINYERTPEWGSKVVEATDGVGVDHVVEVGGAKTLEQSIEAVRIGGEISLIGVLSGVVEDVGVVPVLMQNICIQGIFVGSREMFENLNRALESNGVHPTVDRIFAFDEVRRALEFTADGRHFGNIAIELT